MGPSCSSHFCQKIKTIIMSVTRASDDYILAASENVDDDYDDGILCLTDDPSAGVAIRHILVCEIERRWCCLTFVRTTPCSDDKQRYVCPH